MAVSISPSRTVPSELPLPCSCTVEADGSHARVRVLGELDIATVSRLDAALLEARRTSDGCIALDLSQTSFLDSTGLALVVRWTREAPGLTIVRCSQPVWRLLEITAMTHLVR